MGWDGMGTSVQKGWSLGESSDICLFTCLFFLMPREVTAQFRDGKYRERGGLARKKYTGFGAFDLTCLWGVWGALPPDAHLLTAAFPLLCAQVS